MRRRWLIVLIASTVAIIAFGVYGVTTSPGAVVASPSPSPTLSAEVAEAPASTPVPVSTPTSRHCPPSPPQESPELTATRYFAAWQADDISSMTGLVADPPADFAERHRSFDADLRVSSLSLTPGELRRQGEEAAEMPFQGVREVAGLGRWPFSSVLRLALRGRRAGRCSGLRRRCIPRSRTAGACGSGRPRSAGRPR